MSSLHIETLQIIPYLISLNLVTILHIDCRNTADLIVPGTPFILLSCLNDLFILARMYFSPCSQFQIEDKMPNPSTTLAAASNSAKDISL